MIREFEFYHGAALCRVVSAMDRPVLVHKLDGFSDCAYKLDDSCVIYLKHSTARMSPWGFSFAAGHIADVETLANAYRVVVALVCGEDGIAALTPMELVKLSGEKEDRASYISARRRKKEQYSVSGPTGDLPYKVSGDEFVKKIEGKAFSANKALALGWPVVGALKK